MPASCGLLFYKKKNLGISAEAFKMYGSYRVLQTLQVISLRTLDFRYAQVQVSANS